jgi:hypothetical protein
VYGVSGNVNTSFFNVFITAVSSNIAEAGT